MSFDFGPSYQKIWKQVTAVFAPPRLQVPEAESFAEMTKDGIYERTALIKEGAKDEAGVPYSFDKNIRIVHSLKSYNNSNEINDVNFGKEVNLFYTGKSLLLSNCTFNNAHFERDKSAKPDKEIRFVVNNCTASSLSALNVTNVSVYKGSVREINTRGSTNFVLYDNDTLEKLSTQKVHMLKKVAVRNCPSLFDNLSEKQLAVYEEIPLPSTKTEAPSTI